MGECLHEWLADLTSIPANYHCRVTQMAGRRPVVVHVTTAHPANDVRIFERECRSLAACGRYDVHLAATGMLPGDSGVSHIPLAAIPTTRGARFASGLRKSFGLARALSADVWHFHDPELLPVALRLAQAGEQVIWDAHEDYLSQFTAEESKSWVPAPARTGVRYGMQRLLEAVDRRAAGIVAATPTIAARYSNARTVVVGNEARLEDFSACTPDFDSRRILFTGTAGPTQLFDVVVDAVCQHPDVHLLVAGRGPTPETWREAKARLGERITDIGWLDRSALAATFSQIALGLSTYADIPTNAQNSPNKIFEFCAAGVPVIASPNASNVRFLTEGGGGFLADGFTASAIARAIGSALSDRASWERASQSGREWANRVGSWAQSEQRLLDLYAQIVGEEDAA